MASSPAGKELRGQEAQVFAALAEHVAQERAAVLALQWEAAAAQPERYRFVARRALQQMEVRITGSLNPEKPVATLYS